MSQHSTTGLSTTVAPLARFYSTWAGIVVPGVACSGSRLGRVPLKVRTYSEIAVATNRQNCNKGPALPSRVGAMRAGLRSIETAPPSSASACWSARLVARPQNGAAATCLSHSNDTSCRVVVPLAAGFLARWRAAA